MILRKELLNHLKPAIYRMKNKFKLTESILKEVKAQYTDLYDKTTMSLKIISDFINIPFDEDEAAFITVMVQRAVLRNNSSLLSKKDPRILIVCGLGYSSSRFLYENINSHFQVNIIDIIPFNQLESYNYLKKADIVISTLDFSLDGIDVITVNPIINENDIVKLKNYGLEERKNKIKLSELINFVKNISDEKRLKKKLIKNFGENIYDDTKKEKDSEKSFVNLLSEENIKLNTGVKNLNELIEFTGQTMIDSGLVKKEYIKELKNQLHSADVIEKVMTDSLINMKGKLLSLSNKLAPQIIALDNLGEIQDVIQDGIFEALEELSEYNPEMFRSKNFVEDDEEEEMEVKNEKRKRGRPKKSQ